MPEADFTPLPDEPDLGPPLPPEVKWMYRAILLQKDVEIEHQRSKAWQLLAGRYDDIRYELRNSDDTPAGHAEFFKQCCLTIFGEYRDEVDPEWKQSP